MTTPLRCPPCRPPAYHPCSACLALPLPPRRALVGQWNGGDFLSGRKDGGTGRGGGVSRVTVQGDEAEESEKRAGNTTTTSPSSPLCAHKSAQSLEGPIGNGGAWSAPHFFRFRFAACLSVFFLAFPCLVLTCSDLLDSALLSRIPVVSFSRAETGGTSPALVHQPPPPRRFFLPLPASSCRIPPSDVDSARHNHVRRHAATTAHASAAAADVRCRQHAQSGVIQHTHPSSIPPPPILPPLPVALPLHSAVFYVCPICVLFFEHATPPQHAVLCSEDTAERWQGEGERQAGKADERGAEATKMRLR